MYEIFKFIIVFVSADGVLKSIKNKFLQFSIVLLNILDYFCFENMGLKRRESQFQTINEIPFSPFLIGFY